MKDSVTYQAILEEGEAKGKAEGQAEGRTAAARELLLSLATRRFGWPDEPMKAKIDALTDYERLKTLTERVLDVSSWDELVADLS